MEAICLTGGKIGRHKIPSTSKRQNQIRNLIVSEISPFLVDSMNDSLYISYITEKSSQ